MDTPPYDDLIVAITDYVLDTPIYSQLAYETAHWCLFDSLGCGILALQFPACTQLLGPVVPGAQLAGGARVPGTPYVLDPVQAAFNIGTMIRWLDFNDAWLAAEWGHPSDNLGGILAVADYIGRQSPVPIRMLKLLTLLIKAYEIQGVLALHNSFNRHGLDHVVLVKLATAAAVSVLLNGDRDFLYRTVSQVFVDGQSLRTYRQAPNTGSRKSWAAGDATARAVRLALLSHAGEMGYPSALTAPTWGFYDVLLAGKPLVLERQLDAYVMEHILFKLPYPTEFHAQTAVECAIILHSDVNKRWDDITQIRITTHEAAMRIIVKEGVLRNPADRDHCLQYMVAVALLYGELTAEHYADTIAADPRIDALRNKMLVVEDPQFSADYLDPHKRSIANQIEITWRDGSHIPALTIAYPLGHPRRRLEALPQLQAKCERNLATHYAPSALERLLNVMYDFELLANLSVVDFMALWV